MTRKDTIVAAALINSGMLAVLLIGALKNEEKIEKTAFERSAIEAAVSEKRFVTATEKTKVPEEIDTVLQQYAIKDPVVRSEKEEITLLPKDSPVPVPEPVSAPEEKTETAVPSVRYIEVRIKKGDVLEKIAKAHNCTVSEIMKANDLSSTSLKIGKVLKIPAGVEKPVPSPVKTPLDPTSAKYYTVKAGDNLWTIAVRNHMKVEDLLKLNGMTEEKAKKLKPGDTIRTR